MTTPTFPDRPGANRWLAALLALTLLVYANGLFGPLQFDDYFLATDQASQDWAAWWNAWGLRIRPLLKASHVLSGAFGAALGSIPLGHHLFNLGIHLLVVTVAYRLASDLIPTLATGAPDAPFKRAAAVGCAALPALHPLGTEAVTYISGRSVLLGTLLALATLALHLRGARASSGRTRAACAVAAAGCCVAAVFTREALITAAALPTLWEWSRKERALAPFSRARLWAALRQTWGYGALAALAGLWLAGHESYAQLADVSRQIAQRRLGEPSLLLALDYFGHRLFLLAPLSIDPDPGSPAWPRRLALTLALAGALLGAWRVRRERSHWLFGLLWLLLFLLPIYLVPLRHDPVAERHFYPALFGVGLIGACEGARLAGRGTLARRLVGGFAVLLALALSTLTVVRNADYGTEVALWTAAARASPTRPRVFNNLGVAYMKERRFDRAVASFEQALALEPGHRSAQDNLDRARLKLSTGDPWAEPDI